MGKAVRAARHPRIPVGAAVFPAEEEARTVVLRRRAAPEAVERKEAIRGSRALRDRTAATRQ
jgi:hypothetical protein